MKPFEKAEFRDDAPAVLQDDETFLNDKYQVNIKKLPKGEKSSIVTIKDSPIWKMRHILKRKFGLKVWTPRQAVKEMEKEEKKEAKKK